MRERDKIEIGFQSTKFSIMQIGIREREKKSKETRWEKNHTEKS